MVSGGEMLEFCEHCNEVLKKKVLKNKYFKSGGPRYWSILLVCQGTIFISRCCV